MSHSHFARKNVIQAITETLAKIYFQRFNKLEKDEAELKALEKTFADRNWWQKTSSCHYKDGFARAKIVESIRTNGDWYRDIEIRLEVTLAFCRALEDDTIPLSAQEFWDFHRFYRG